ncbi:MAG TPA: hypothetical protein VFF06_05040 [Polyangia bacterium]|nr:hypothetical protein [Polyangia bacterium]
MRVTSWLGAALAASLAVSIAAAGCRTRPFDQPISDDGSFSTMDLGAADLPRAIDLGPPPPDLSQLGCGALVQCVAQCSGADQTCFGSCEMSATGKAQTQFNAALGCGQQWCLGQNGGPQRCAIDSTGQMFIDAPGVPPGDCNVCLSNVFAQLFNTMCFPPDDSACKPPACTTLYEICINN